MGKVVTDETLADRVERLEDLVYGSGDEAAAAGACGCTVGGFGEGRPVGQVGRPAPTDEGLIEMMSGAPPPVDWADRLRQAERSAAGWKEEAARHYSDWQAYKEQRNILCAFLRQLMDHVALLEGMLTDAESPVPDHPGVSWVQYDWARGITDPDSYPNYVRRKPQPAAGE